MHVFFPPRLHLTLDCRQFSQAARSLGPSPPLPEGVLDSTSIYYPIKWVRVRSEIVFRQPNHYKILYRWLTMQNVKYI